MLNKLICPNCKSKLSIDLETLRCNTCSRDFISQEGIPILLPGELSEFKKIEIDFYEKHFGDVGCNFGFVETDWDKNTYGLLDFMKVIEGCPQEAKILELGAGNGQYSLILNKRGFKNTVISDISVSGLAAAKKYLEKNNGEDLAAINERFFAFDSEHIPFEDGTFDIIFLVASLHHLPHPESAIAEMERCVKPGGLIIIAVEPNTWPYYVIRPIARLLRVRLIDKSKDSFSIGDETTHGFSMRKLKKLFKARGIKVVKTQRVWYLTGIVYYFPELMKRLFKVNIQVNPRVRQAALAVDRLIGKIPVVRGFSFHNTIIGIPASSTEHDQTLFA